MKAKTLTDKLQQLPAARREQVEARAAELVAEAAHNRDVKGVKGAAMTPEQMKQRAGASNLRKLKKLASEHRNFPLNTCCASRHLHLIADGLVSKRRKLPIEQIWEPHHMAETMYSVLASLWEARTKLAKLGGEDG